MAAQPIDNLSLGNGDGVFHCRNTLMRVGFGRWNYADANSRDIAANWADLQKSNPNYFDGRIYLVDGYKFTDGEFAASLLASDFKSYIYWRAQDFPDAGVWDGFGSALIRSSDGDLMIGRQRSGNVNAGLAYAPAGFIDQQDVAGDRSIDIAASAIREAAEETGIPVTAFIRDDGFYLTRSGPQLSIGVPLRVAMTTREFLRHAEAHIGASEDSELDAILAVGGRRDVEGVAMPAYMSLLIEALFAGERSDTSR